MQTEAHANSEATPGEGSPVNSTTAIAAVNEPTQQQVRNQKHHQKWNRRMKIFFCCLGYKKNKDSIADVASIFAEFYSDLNVPSSDIAAGFVLLSKYQAAQRQWILESSSSSSLLSPTPQPPPLPPPPGLKFEPINEEAKQKAPIIDRYLSNIPINSETKFLDISTADDSHLINDLIYYMNYSLAIFGWPMQMVDDPCMLCCIYPYLRLSPCCSGGGGVKDQETTSQQQDDTQRVKNYPIILEDNCCGCHVASFERRLAQHNYEIIYVSYKSSVNIVPFLVAADHSKQTIVVAIRGSMSLSDMVTDMNGTVDKIPLDNCPDDWLCHRGITRAAQYVKKTLLDERILERAFECRPDLGSKEYQLVLCGHSLGAGAAAILGVILRPHYPTLRAYLYSPPGGILSMSVVEYTKQFATGIILGNDTVPRLGVAQLERLRYHILLSLQSTQKSPGRILARALCPSMCFGSNKVEYDPSQSIDLLHGLEAISFDHNGTKIPFQVQPQVLYVPGRLIHVVKNYSFQTKTRRFLNGPIYQAVWTDNADYDRVLISEGMFLDHLPNNLMHAMKMLFSKTLPGVRRGASATGEQQTTSVKVDVPQEPEEIDNNNYNNNISGDKTSEMTTTTATVVVKQQVAVQTVLPVVDNHQRQKQEKEKDYEVDEEHERVSQMAQRKNVIEDDNNNNNININSNNNNNNNNKEDENNNNKLEAY